MPVRFFGQFLLERGAITPQQLATAVRQQEASNPRFGRLAVAAGRLTDAQLEQALEYQKANDVRIGEAAVRLGFLTNEEVDRLLRAQRNSRVMLGAALVDVGALSAEAVESLLAEFRAEQREWEVSTDIRPELDPTGIGASLLDLTGKFFLRADIPVKPSDIARGAFISRSPAVISVHVEFIGTLVGRFVLELERSLSSALASALTKRPVASDADDSLLDVQAEFLGSVAGALATMLARTGRTFEYAPPRTSRPPRMTDALRIELTTPVGGGRLVVAPEMGR